MSNKTVLYLISRLDSIRRAALAAMLLAGAAAAAEAATGASADGRMIMAAAWIGLAGLAVWVIAPTTAAALALLCGDLAAFKEAVAAQRGCLDDSEDENF